MGGVVGRPSQRPRLGPLGMTHYQVLSVIETWKLLEQDVAKYSTMAFVRFFGKYPHYRRYFQSITGVELSKVATDARTQSHFRVIFTALGSLIQSLAKRPILLDGKYHYLALVHKDMDLTLKDFNRFRDVFIQFLTEQFKLDIFHESSWYAFLTASFSQICIKMDQIRKEDQEATLLVTKESAATLEKKRRKIFHKYSKKQNPEYWSQRRRFWKTQKEMWGDELNCSSSVSSTDAENQPGENSIPIKVSGTPHDHSLEIKETAGCIEARKRRRASMREVAYPLHCD